jgi:hypothetical protein
MASGYPSLHPAQRAIVQELGISSAAVTQGWGHAKASAGYHDAEGTYGGPFSSCLDLSVSALTSDLLNRLAQAAICPFVRTAATGWNGSAHCHCVTVGLRDGRGNVTILPGPRSQILDWIRGLSGLVGHREQPAWNGWLQNAEQRADLRRHYEGWAPDLATGVWRGDDRIPCYAWLEFGRVVRADVRRLGEALGGRVTWTSNGAHLYDDHGKEVALHTGKLEVDYYRADVREIAEAFGYQVGFRALDGGTSCRVDLSR